MLRFHVCIGSGVPISVGKAETILIIAAEMMTRHLDWTDRATCVLFGDGAGAVVVRKGDGLKSIIITAKGDDQLLVIGNTFCKSPTAGRSI